MEFESGYLNVASRIIELGRRKENRTGTDTLVLRGPAVLTHDCSTGFPMLNTCKKPFKVVATELEGFIKGITDKNWYQERSCRIWDEWASPASVPNRDKQKMLVSRDLGPIYGYQWNEFDKEYSKISDYDSMWIDRFKIDWENPKPENQLAVVFKSLRTNPYDRRMVVSSWNPHQIADMALPPCHVMWNLAYDGEEVHLTWFQRSADWALGVPFNLASYTLLLEVLCKLTGRKPGLVTGIFADAHIYVDHIEGMTEQINRWRDIEYTCKAPKLILPEYPEGSNPHNFSADTCSIEGYCPMEKISYPIAV